MSRAQPGIDRTRLLEFAADRLGLKGPVTEIERISGGQSNPTFFVTIAGRRLVLRSQPLGELLPSAHAIDREFRVMQALAKTEMPVPKMLAYADDRSITGAPFYLMERIEGRVFHTAEIAGVAPSELRAMYLAAAEMLARLHKVDWRAIGLEDFGRPGDYFQRQINRWTRQWRSSKIRDMPALEKLIDWLPAHIPADDRATICHGDYRIGNVIFDPTAPRVAAVLDWELSTIGHPLADLAFFCIPYHTAPTEYGGVLGLDHQAMGIPTQDEIVAAYSAIAGRNEKLAPFHLAFALFRFSVIFAGIAARAAQGNAVGDAAGSAGAIADGFARRAAAIAGV